jgi:hypothetical protein
VSWKIIFHDDFDPEFDEFTQDVQDNLLAAARAVQMAGPKAGRPHVDTLKGSKHANMKELRFTAHDGTQVWRVAFAFDPRRNGIVLVGGDKQGKDEKRFYKALIKVADARLDAHLKAIKASK